MYQLGNSYQQCTYHYCKWQRTSALQQCQHYSRILTRIAEYLWKDHLSCRQFQQHIKSLLQRHSNTQLDKHYHFLLELQSTRQLVLAHNHLPQFQILKVKFDRVQRQHQSNQSLLLKVSLPVHPKSLFNHLDRIEDSQYLQDNRILQGIKFGSFGLYLKHNSQSLNLGMKFENLNS